MGAFFIPSQYLMVDGERNKQTPDTNSVHVHLAGLNYACSASAEKKSTLFLPLVSVSVSVSV